MVSQSGSGAGGLEGSPNVDLRTPAVQGRRHSMDGTPGGGETEQNLRNILETSWTHRGVRTGVNPLRGMDPLRGGDPLRGPARGAESSNPLFRRSDAPDATEGGAGFNMDQFRDLIKQMINEEKEKESADMRARADPMMEAREQARQMIAEELAKERRQYASLGNAPHASMRGEAQKGGEQRVESGMGNGPSMYSGADFGHTATIGNSKFNVAMPPKFNPAEHSWMLWRPQVISYFEMIGLEGILDKVTGDDFSLQVNRYAIGTLQQISPSQDAAWMSTLRLRYAYEAWDQLKRAYGSRTELDMQKKLYEFESAAQRENETVREWTIRLERQVTELNVMAKEAAKEDVMGYNEHRDTAVYESTHKFRL
jgi:hypothetical protein